jgi:hypothetical protein
MSCGPTAAELAQIRADVAAIALPLSCAIQRATLANDAWGTQTATYATVATVS